MFSFFRRAKAKDEDKKDKNANKSGIKITEDKSKTIIKPQPVTKSIIVPLKSDTENSQLDDAINQKNLIKHPYHFPENTANLSDRISSSGAKITTKENNLNISHEQNNNDYRTNDIKLNFNIFKKSADDEKILLPKQSNIDIERKLNYNLAAFTRDNKSNSGNATGDIKRNDSLIYIDDERESSVSSTATVTAEQSSTEKSANDKKIQLFTDNKISRPDIINEIPKENSPPENFGTAPNSPTDGSTEEKSKSTNKYCYFNSTDNDIVQSQSEKEQPAEQIDRKENLEGAAVICSHSEKPSTALAHDDNYLISNDIFLSLLNANETIIQNNINDKNHLSIIELNDPNESFEHSVLPFEPLYTVVETNTSPEENYPTNFPLNNINQIHRIPDIQITDCSDSEGENEVIFVDFNDYNSCIDRIHRSILSDIEEEDDERFSDASDIELDTVMEEPSNYCRRNVVHQESKFQEQIKRLTCEIEVKEVENSVLKQKITELQKEIEDNKKALEHYINDCESQKLKEAQSTIDHLRFKLKDLESQLKESNAEREKLQIRFIDLKTEKETEIQLIQQAFNDLEKEKNLLELKFSNEYEKLRTVNTDREQHLLDDFEWKLREVEQMCKKKLEEKERQTSEKILEIQTQLNGQIEKLKLELDKLRVYEIELTELKSSSFEQQRSLRTATRNLEQLQITEVTLNEEIKKLRSSLEKERNYLATVQGIHSREIAEKDRKHQFKLEQQKNELTSEWEDKIRRELTRLKLELEKNFKEEKRALIEELKNKHENEIKDYNERWNKKLSDSIKEIERLNQKFSNKEEHYKEEILKMQTNSDRDILELRRKIDKLDMSYQEKFEKKDEQHEKDIECLKSEYDERLRRCEEHWAEQLNIANTSLECVKRDLQNEFAQQLEELHKKQEEELEEQCRQLLQQKEDEIARLDTLHLEQSQQLRQQFEEELNCMRIKENDLVQMSEMLKTDLSRNAVYIEELETAVRNNNDRNNNENNINSLEQNEDFRQRLELALSKRECEYNKAISELKERYESELKQWKSRVNEPQTPSLPNSHSSCGIVPTASSRSSRRKGRGRNKNKNSQTSRPDFNKQFSSCSL